MEFLLSTQLITLKYEHRKTWKKDYLLYRRQEITLVILNSVEISKYYYSSQVIFHDTLHYVNLY